MTHSPKHLRTLLATAALATAGLTHAQLPSGDTLGMNPNTMRTEAVVGTASVEHLQPQAYALQGDVVAPGAELIEERVDAPVSRDEVRAEFDRARIAGILSRPGEASDTRSILKAREADNARMAVEMLAAQEAEERAIAWALVEEDPMLALLVLPADAVVIDME